MPKRLLIGLVTRDKSPTTRRVEVPRLVTHKVYGKTMHQRTICYAHDAEGISKNGDTVEIEESRPLSKLKRWVLTRVVREAKASSTVEKVSADAAGTEAAKA
jgi:small subunit ribosomal protein S17